ncbi:hypothetical protein V8C26DRAFT_54479 [Trichoderma gracile]
MTRRISNHRRHEANVPASTPTPAASPAYLHRQHCGQSRRPPRCTTYHFHPHPPPWVTGVVDLPCHHLHNSARLESEQHGVRGTSPHSLRFSRGVCVRLWGGTFFRLPPLLNPFPVAWDRQSREDSVSVGAESLERACASRMDRRLSVPSTSTAGKALDSGCRAAYLQLPSAAPRQTTGVRPMDPMCFSLLRLQAPETCTIISVQAQLSQPSLALKP